MKGDDALEKLSREDVDSPSLGVFKARLDGATWSSRGLGVDDL